MSIQSGWTALFLMNSTRTPTSMWLALIISARTKRCASGCQDMRARGAGKGATSGRHREQGARLTFSTSVKDDSMMEAALALSSMTGEW